MKSYDFLNYVEELHQNRGVPIKEIADTLEISDNSLYKIRAGLRRVTDKTGKKADRAIPMLLEKYGRLKGAKENPVFETKQERALNIIQAKEYQSNWRKKLNGSFWEEKQQKEQKELLKQQNYLIHKPRREFEEM